MGGENNIFGVNGRRFGDRVEIGFCRNLLTNDKYDVNITNSKLAVIYAFGGDHSVDFENSNYYKHSQYGMLKINFFSEQPVRKSRAGLIWQYFLKFLYIF